MKVMVECPQSVTFLVPENTPTATYTITFQGVTVKDCNSTWCYIVSVTGAPGLSHWVLGVFESCQELLSEKLLLVTRNGVELEEGIGYELGTNDGVFGIKFEIGVEGGQSAIYCITVQGIYEPTAVDVAVKGGNNPAQKEEDALCGPSCVVIPCKVTPCQAITDLLESIALQETGLSHIINAEGEKIQTALEVINVSIDDLIAINQSVANTLTKIIKMEMLLEFKLEEINRLNCPDCPPCPTTHV
jgi:hypothetical protein